MNCIISPVCLLVFLGVVLSGTSSVQALVGCTASSPGKWPFFAGLFYEYTTLPGVPLCGAVIWDKDTLLTAAHCLSKDPKHPESFDVYMGYKRWAKPRDKQYKFKVKKIIMHPSYREKWSYYYDIALIFLDRSIDFNGINKKVQWVNGPKSLKYLDTSACVAIGWGGDNENKLPTSLMEAVLPILDKEICENQWVNYDSRLHLCAGHVGPSTPIGLASGDSGGPLVCPQKANPDVYSLVGIASYGQLWPNCGSKPSYFTKVKRFKKWINTVHPRTVERTNWWTNLKKRWFGSRAGGPPRQPPRAA